MSAVPMTTERLLRLYTSAPKAFWRHDVDVSLQAGVAMAKFAELAGVKCTFAIMARCDFYNPFSYSGRYAIEEILKCGHRLIPHVHYKDDGQDLIYDVVQRDCALWGEEFPGEFDLSLVCFHMPPQVVLWKRYPGMGSYGAFNHCHEPQWLGRYVSDSRREWTEEKEGLVANDMQIALHPEHWFMSQSSCIPEQRTRRLV